MSEPLGAGTPNDPWRLQTPPLTSEFTMHRNLRKGRDVLVCTVGKTILLYDARCLEDLRAMLKEKKIGLSWARRMSRKTPNPGPWKCGGAPPEIRSAVGMA